MAKQDYRITGNGFNEDRETVTGRHVRGLGPGPKWPTERKDAKVIAMVIAVPVGLLLIIVTWFRH